jgi:hypothetical protein
MTQELGLRMFIALLVVAGGFHAAGILTHFIMKRRGDERAIRAMAYFKNVGDGYYDDVIVTSHTLVGVSGLVLASMLAVATGQPVWLGAYASGLALYGMALGAFLMATRHRPVLYGIRR